MKKLHSKTKNIEPGALKVGHSAPLWRTRRVVRKIVHTKHRLTGKKGSVPQHRKLLHVYSNVDEFARTFLPVRGVELSKAQALSRVRHMIRQLGYEVVYFDEDKPWGGMYQLADWQAERFIKEFFPGLSLEKAKLGRDNVRLSPKFLLLEPGKRLSWQYHNRRAERWHFLTPGTYWLSDNDEQPEPVLAPAGTIVQLSTKARHRVLSSNNTGYTLVAEVWQHTDPDRLSDEADIVRLQDDYRRT